MIRNIRIVLLFYEEKKREMDFFNHEARFHENVEPLCL